MANKGSKYSWLLIFPLTGLLFFSCVETDLYHHYQSIESSMWNETDAFRFDVSVTDTLAAYDVFVEIRNDNSYSYENLWLFVTLDTPWNGRRKDTLNCALADPYGKWLGKGFSLYTLSVAYDTAVVFPRSGTYSYTIRQGMREKELKGITDIGLRVTPKMR